MFSKLYSIQIVAKAHITHHANKTQYKRSAAVGKSPPQVMSKHAESCSYILYIILWGFKMAVIPI